MLVSSWVDQISHGTSTSFPDSEENRFKEEYKPKNSNLVSLSLRSTKTFLKASYLSNQCVTEGSVYDILSIHDDRIVEL